MNSPLIGQFGLEQIPASFEGSVTGDPVVGPGSYLGRMSPTGLVPIPVDDVPEQENYTF
jgi:hypothetical protein